MEFENALRNACKDLEGVQGISLIGLDGIGIASVILEGEPDLESLAAELTTFLKTLRSTSSTINGDDIHQMVVYTPSTATILHGVTKDYFILAMVKRPALLGKVRFRMIKASHDILEAM